MSDSELEEKIQQAKNVEENADFFSASFFYKDALLIARNIGNSEKIKWLKKKVVEMNQKSQGQMKEVSVEHPISPEHIEQINKFITFILEQDFVSQLKIIGSHPNFYPHYEHLEKSSPPLYTQLASNSVFSEQGHLVKGGSDGVYSWLMKMYEISQNVSNQFYLLRILKQMIDNGSLNTQSLNQYLRDRKLFTDNQMKLLEVGTERFFAKDYISALHILVPQFENAFLIISEKLGIDIISLNQTKEISTQTKTLSTTQLESEEFQKIWGKDLCLQIKFIMFEPLGYKLRHLVAHGEISAEACNFTTVSMILYLFLALAARVHNSKAAENIR